jgi:aspartate/tyrosine/aromatic aminotransferase
MENAKAFNRLQKIVGFDVTRNVTPTLESNSTAGSFWDNLTVPEPDEVFHVKGLANKDKDPRKINLSVGAYRGEDGKPYILNVVKKANAQLALELRDNKFNREYLPITGDAEFAAAAARLIFGQDSRATADGVVASVQSLSGTGALRLAFEFIKRHLPAGTTVYISNPTWGNHKGISKNAGVPFKSYRYWHPASRSLDFAGMCDDVRNAPNGSVILLHATAHNPTGVDPTNEQWHQLAQLCKEKGHLPLFDSAYQGFASGNLEQDAYGFRYFVNQGFEMLVCQSFAKNFGLYNARCGAFHIVTSSKSQASAAKAQVAKIVRPMYSNPPSDGAKIVKTVLNDAALSAEWHAELKGMSNRINDMRVALRSKIEALGTPGDWSHITSQIGMFSFTGLSKAQCKDLVNKHHVYLLSSGRISMAGINTRNVDHLARSINAVVTGKGN